MTFFYKDSWFFESCFIEILWSINTIYQTKLNFEAKQINRVHSLNVEILLINTTLILKHARFLISNNSVAIKYIISFLIIVSQYWEFIIHYFLDVSYIPSCMSGLRNFKMARLRGAKTSRHSSSPHGYGKIMNIFMSHFSTSVYPG